MDAHLRPPQQPISISSAGARSARRTAPPPPPPRPPRLTIVRDAEQPVRPAPAARTAVTGSSLSPLLAAMSPPAELLAHIVREAALAARAALDYSVVVLEVRRPWIDAHTVRRLIGTACSAMLPGDELGWLDADRIALSLPLTDAPAAAARVAAIAGCHPAPGCVVYSNRADPGEPWVRAAAVPPLPLRPLEALLHEPLPRWKRAVDVVGALVALVLTAPIMLVAAVLVRLSSPGPVILRQRRAGLHGVPFVLFKFRTMVQGAEAMKAALLRFNERSGPVFKMTNDPRVTKVGRLLRATSIDELPQLWNVLRGEMSLVGPRPPTLDEVPQYHAWHRRRLGVKPGITCFWQIAARSGIAFDDWVRMDLRYIARRSLLCDLRVLAATLPAVLSRRGAH